MDFIVILSIVIAIFGAVTIAAVLSQSEGRAASKAAPVEPAAEGAEQSPPTLEEMPAHVASVEAAFAAFDQITPPDRPPAPEAAPPPAEPQPSIESITALYTHASDGLAIPDSALQLNAAGVIAAQIELMYEEYVRLEDERTKLAEALLTNMLFEKIERSAGRLEIATERQTLDLRDQLSRVSADYDRVQFRLGSLQHLNARLSDPRVAQQIDELVQDVRRLAGKR